MEYIVILLYVHIRSLSLAHSLAINVHTANVEDEASRRHIMCIVILKNVQWVSTNYIDAYERILRYISLFRFVRSFIRCTITTTHSSKNAFVNLTLKNKYNKRSVHIMLQWKKGKLAGGFLFVFRNRSLPLARSLIISSFVVLLTHIFFICII
jgi:hypothetical protein